MDDLGAVLKVAVSAITFNARDAIGAALGPNVLACASFWESWGYPKPLSIAEGRKQEKVSAATMPAALNCAALILCVQVFVALRTVIPSPGHFQVERNRDKNFRSGGDRCSNLF